MTIGGRYTVALRDLVRDPAVREELDRIQAAFAGLGSDAVSGDAEKGLDTGLTIQTRSIADDGSTENGVRWLSGPWLLGPDGNVSTRAVVKVQVTTSQNNFAPVGIDTAVGLELDATADCTITGIRVATRQRRVLLIVNRSGFTFTFPVNDTGSIAAHRFEFGNSASSPLKLGPGELAWFYYDVTGQRWHLQGLPAVASANMPSALATVMTTYVDITDAQALTLNSVPVVLVPAQGANTVIQILSVMARVIRATGYGGSPQQNIWYNGLATDLIGNMALISTGTVDRTVQATVNGYTLDGASAPANLALVLRSTFDTTGGASGNKIRIYLAYRVVTVL